MNRIAWLIAGILVIVLVALRVQMRDADRFERDFHDYSKAPYGSKLLIDWLRTEQHLSVKSTHERLAELDYHTTGAVSLVVVTDFMELDPQSMDALDDLLERGSTVILAGMNFADTLLSKYHLAMDYVYGGKVTPLLDARFPGQWLVEDTRAPGLNKALISKHVYWQRLRERRGEEADETDTALTDPIDLANGWRSIIGSEAYPAFSIAAVSRRGPGTLILCSAPQLFTNYAMLYDSLWKATMAIIGYLPPGKVLWDEHYKPMIDEERLAPLSYVNTHRGLQLAYVILLGGLGTYLVIAGRRKQRAIPSIPPVKNTTLEFLSAITSLYWLKRNNATVLARMAMQFRKHVTHKLRLPIEGDADTVARSFSASTGVDINATRRLVALAQSPLPTTVTDTELLTINADLELFFRQTPV